MHTVKCSTAQTILLLVSQNNVCHCIHMHDDGCCQLLAGYKTQMIVKLLVAHLLKAEFYLVLDSDIMPLRPFGTQELFIDGRATYTKAREHHEWYQASAKLGQFDVSGKCAHDRIGEFGPTPATIHKRVSQMVISHLKRVHGSRWLEVVFQADHLGWTEFTLYHLTACTFNMMDMYHDTGGRWVYWKYYGDLGWNFDDLFGSTNDAIFAIFQDAIDGMTLRNVLKKLHHRFCRQHHHLEKSTIS